MAVSKTKPEPERRIAALSESRYNAGAAHKRVWGSSTITRFFVWWEADPNIGDKPKAVLVEGCGATPGERRSHAVARFREAFACVDHEECRRDPTRSDACCAERLKRKPFNGAW